MQPGTQLHAKLHGWSFAMTYEEIANVALSAGVINGFILPKGEKAVSFPMPWDGQEDDEPVSDEDRARLKQELAARSAFG